LVKEQNEHPESFGGKDLAATSNGAVAKLSGKVQWVQSHIAADNTFCIYLAESEDPFASTPGWRAFPIAKINEVITVIDPMTAHS